MLLQIIFDTIPFISEPQYAAIPLMAALAVGSAATKAGTGIYQTIKGNQIDDFSV